MASLGKLYKVNKLAQKFFICNILLIHHADVALDVSSHHPTLAVERDGNGETALHLLARKPSAFSGGDQLHIWNTVINSSKLFSLSFVEV